MNPWSAPGGIAAALIRLLESERQDEHGVGRDPGTLPHGLETLDDWILFGPRLR